MQAVHLAGSIFYALKILPARGTRPNKNNNKKMIEGSARLIGSAEKVKM